MKDYSETRIFAKVTAGLSPNDVGGVVTQLELNSAVIESAKPQGQAGAWPPGEPKADGVTGGERLQAQPDAAPAQDAPTED